MDIEEQEQQVVPLLPSSRENEFNPPANGERRNEFLDETIRQLKLAGPLVSVSFLTFFLQVVSVMYVGHLGELSLAGASIATSFASVTGFSFLRGTSSALETFCGQSYGAKQHYLLGVHLQRATIVLLLLCLPLVVLWAQAGPILLFLGQDPEISAEAGTYARFMIPSIFGFALQECHIRFLQAQNNVVPMMLTSGFTVLIHLVICRLLVFESGLGSKGAALANAISYWINALILIVYVRVSPSCKKTWTGFSRDAFRGVYDFVKLAIPSAIMLSLEIWSFEMMVLLAGLLPNPKLETSVLSISLNTCTMIYMIPLGLSAAVSTRVSNELGAGKPRIARLAVAVSLTIVISEAVIAGIFLVVGHDLWGYFYTDKERVVKYVGQMMFLITVSHFFDGIQSVLSGACRGCGWQKIGALINLGAYYLIGIPFGILLAFMFDIGGKGLWVGITVALFVQGFLLSIVTACTNWEREAKKATHRVHNTVNQEG